MQPREGGGLYIFLGTPGTGKTTVAGMVREKLGRGKVSHYKSDAFRQRFFPRGIVSDDIRQGREASDRVYAALVTSASRSLRRGRIVIVDATFANESLRERFIKVAQRRRVPYLMIQVVAGDEIVNKRIEERLANPHEVLSKVTVKESEEIKRKFQPIQQPYLIFENNFPSIDDLKKKVNENFLSG